MASGPSGSARTFGTFFHSPGTAGQADSLLTKVVHMANFACNNQGLDNGLGVFPTNFSEVAWFDAGLSVDDIPRIIEEVNNLSSGVEEILLIGES